jgi:hypothetical protein
MKKLSESVWSDIHKRSNGESVRKEDDINLLKMDDMISYIYTVYDKNPDFNANAHRTEISDEVDACSIPMFVYDRDLHRMSIRYIKNGSPTNIRLITDINSCKEFFDKLNDKFKLDLPKYNFGTDHIDIQAKDGTVSNTLVIDVIDTIIDGIESSNNKNLKPALLKKER